MSCLTDQPHGVEIDIVDDIFVKQMIVKSKDTLIPQHSHTWDHLSMLAVGAVRIWRDGVLDGDYVAPAGILIKAGVKHTFRTLEDNTIIYCIHNIMRSGKIDVLEEHSLEVA